MCSRDSSGASEEEPEGTSWGVVEKELREVETQITTSW